MPFKMKETRYAFESDHGHLLLGSVCNRAVSSPPPSDSADFRGSQGAPRNYRTTPRFRTHIVYTLVR